MELDHVFILCEVGGPEAAVLSRLGLKEGRPNTHPGQGTACRRFLFSDAYLELLWVSDEEAARSEAVFRTRLWERWSQRGQGACPFGIVLRPGSNEPDARPPFPTWAYAPPYMPEGLVIDVAVGTPLTEPEFFYMGFQRGRSLVSIESAGHPIGAGEVTGITVGTPGPLPESWAARLAEDQGVVSFHQSTTHVLGVTLDRAGAGRTADLRPDLPLTVHW